MNKNNVSTILSVMAIVISCSAIAIQFLGVESIRSRALALFGAVSGEQPMVTPPPTATDKTAEVSDGEEKGSTPSAEDLKEQTDRLVRLEARLAQFEQVIRSSGLDAAESFLMPPPGSDEPLLAQIGEQYATRAKFEERRKQALDRAKEMRQRDLKTYGDANYQQILDLYEKARLRRGPETAEQQTARKAALDKLMTNYPDSWSTSVAVAEQALGEAINRNTAGVESYYESLVSASPYTEVVTDQGINAIPTIQTYLARQYAEEGKVEEASALLDALDSSGDSIILEPNEMGEPTARSAQEIVQELRDKIAQ